MNNSSSFIENLKQLFAECDTANSGSLGRKEFNELCDKIGLNKEAAEETFQRLDIDKNGRITFDEFTAGFNQYKQTSSGATPAPSSASSTTTTTTKSTSLASPPSKSSTVKSPTQTRVTRLPNVATSSTSLKSNLPQTTTRQIKPSLAGASNASAPTSLASSPQPPPRFKPTTNHVHHPSTSLEQTRPASAIGHLTGSTNRQKIVARKNASPLGVMSLGSTGSSTSTTSNNNLLLLSTTGGPRSSSATDFTASTNIVESNATSTNIGVDSFGDNSSKSINTSSSSSNLNAGANTNSSVVVYSSEHMGLSSSGLDYGDQANGSGQFGSLISSNGSFSQLRNMQDLLECVQKLQSENQILTQIFFKDKREREEYISQLGEEFDQQVREVEERANRRAREELESEKKRLREMMQTERETLQHHYQTIEKMSNLIKTSNTSKKSDDIDGIDKVKSKLEDTFLENRQLKKSLLDTKTDVAMIWKEMERLKRQYEDKLTNAYQRNNETRSECDHIKQQLNLMKDSNRKLQDASDVITNYITDKVEPVIKCAIGVGDTDADGNVFLDPSAAGSAGGSSSRHGAVSQANSRRGSILSQYLNGTDSPNNNNNNKDSDRISLDGSNINGSSVHSGDLESMGSCNRWRTGEDADGEALSGTSNSTAPGVGLLSAGYTKNKSRPISPAKIEVSLTRADEDKIESSSPLDGKQTLTTLKKTSSFTKSADNLQKVAQKQHQLQEQLQTQSQSQQQQKQQISNLVKSRLNNHNATSSSINEDHSSSESSSNFRALYRRRDEDQVKTLKHHRLTPHHSVSLMELGSKSSNNNSSVKESRKSIMRSKFGKRSLIGRHFFIGSRDSTHSDAPLTSEAESKPSTKSSSLDYVTDGPSVEPADGPSRATFDIILVGDSFVGKSSFAARFMEGSFVQGLISNCSIDFKTKAYKVEGVNYTINLWDTAGQERFRSITASYFRKADGIILMYDVTEKRSYLNVRNWMSTISDTASENVAVLLVGNKIDLRLRDNKDECVPTKEGARLAREYGIMFLETSVKTGMNLVPSMGKLIKLIAKNNMPADEDKDRIKLSKKSKAFSCMC